LGRNQKKKKKNNNNSKIQTAKKPKMDDDHNCEQLFFSFLFLFPASAAYKTHVENIM
jgi:hypothetical protein